MNANEGTGMKLTNAKEVLLVFFYARKSRVEIYVPADNFLGTLRDLLPRLGRVTHVQATHHPGPNDRRAFYSWSFFTEHADYTICGVENREEFGRRLVTTRSKNCAAARAYASETIGEGC